MAPHTHTGSSIIPHTNQARPVPPPRRKARKLGYDPTHTTVLRNAFAAEMNKRFIRLRGLIRRAIVDQDCFGLTQLNSYSLPGRRAYAFSRSTEKVEAFMIWLQEQVDREILEILPGMGTQIGRGVERAWTDMYVQSAYQKGIERGRAEMIGAGYDVPTVTAGGGIHAAFNAGQHLDRAGLIYSRTYTQLKGITDQMGNQISAVLSQGMIDGKHPRELARLLTKTITGPVGGLGITDSIGRFIPAQRRATILARTEVIRAHHVATIQEYENWGAGGVRVEAELRTAGDDRVCDECAALHGNVYTLEEAYSLIPVHPQCRCCCIPLSAHSVEREGTEDEVRKAREAGSAEAEGRKQADVERKAAEEEQKRLEMERQFALDREFGRRKAIEEGEYEKWLIAEEMKRPWYHSSSSVNDMRAQYRDTLGIDGVEGFAQKNSSKFRLAEKAGEAIGNDVLRRFPRLDELRKSAGGRGRLSRMDFSSYNAGTKHHPPSLTKGVTGYYSNAWRGERARISMLPGSFTRTEPTLYIGRMEYTDGIFRTAHNVGVDFQSIVRHEYGHHVMNALVDDNTRDIIGKFYDAVGQATIQKEISHYAGSNAQEMFAEIFAAYTSPLYEASPVYKLPDWAEAMIKTITGARVDVRDRWFDPKDIVGGMLK